MVRQAMELELDCLKQGTYIAKSFCSQDHMPNTRHMHAGMNVPITYTLAYMPPEVAVAVELGDRNIVAEAAADVWALGVMAYELLTQTTLFPPLAGDGDEAWNKLLGKAPLPWEKDAPGAAERQAQLRALKRGVLACLHRDPSQRPSCDSVLSTWTNIFDTHSKTRNSRTVAA